MSALNSLTKSLLLLTTEGRSTGEAEVNLMAYRKHQGNYIVAATSHTPESERGHFKPDWYLNLKENPIVRIELNGLSLSAKAVTPVGRARLQLWPIAEEISSINNHELPRDTAIVVLAPRQNQKLGQQILFF